MDPTNNFKIAQSPLEQPEAGGLKPVASSSESLVPLFQQQVLDPSQTEAPKPLADHTAKVKHQANSPAEGLALSILQIPPGSNSPISRSQAGNQQLALSQSHPALGSRKQHLSVDSMPRPGQATVEPSLQSSLFESSSSSSSAEPLSVAVPGSVQPAIAVAVPRPARSNSIIEDKKNEWIAAHIDPKMQAAVKALIEKIVHVNQDQFEESFRKTLADLSVLMGNKPFSAAVQNGKSNLWMATLAEDLQKGQHAVPKIPLVLGPHLIGTSAADFPENIVLFDDAIYSGEQITRFIRDMVAAIDARNSQIKRPAGHLHQSSCFAYPNFTVACPYITRIGKTKLDQLAAELRPKKISVSVAAHENIPTVAESITDEGLLSVLEKAYWPAEVKDRDRASRSALPSDNAALASGSDPSSHGRTSPAIRPSRTGSKLAASSSSAIPTSIEAGADSTSPASASSSSAADPVLESSSSASSFSRSVPANSSVPSRAKQPTRQTSQMAKIFQVNHASQLPEKYVANKDGAHSRGLTYFDHKVPDKYSFPEPLALGLIYLKSGKRLPTIRFIDKTDPPYRDLEFQAGASA